MTTKIYGLKNCDTCRQAFKALQAAGHEVVLVDVRADRLNDDQLASFFAQFGEKLINSRSTTWRQLDEAERERPHPELVKAHPSLMKRPVIAHKGILTLGFDAGVRVQLGL